MVVLPPPLADIRFALMPDTETCYLCAGTGTRTDGMVVDAACNGCNSCMGTGEMENRQKQLGWIHDPADSEEAGTCEAPADAQRAWVTSDGPDSGTEWAYVMATHALFVFERRYGNPADDQGHGVGMFGMGASDLEVGGYWAPRGEFRWDGDEPDWDEVQAGRATPI